MSRTALAASLILVCCVIGNAQEVQPVSTYEHLKVLEPFLGPWISESPAKEDIPGFVKKGTPIVVKFNYRWALKKNAIVMDWSAEADGTPPFKGKVLIGWCPKGKKIVSRSFTTSGGTSEGIWEVDGKSLKITNSDCEPDGTESSSVIFNKLTDDGKMIWQATDQVKGGEEQPDSETIEFEPAKSEKR